MKLANSKLWLYITKRYYQEYRWATLEILEPNSDANYLDLGCGDGKFTTEIGDRIGTSHIFGIEIIVDLIREARDRGITVMNSELGKPLLIKDNSVDVVTANQVIEHLDDTDTFIKECFRILKPKGYMVISTNNLATWHWIIMLILGIQPPTACISDEIPSQDFGSTYKEERLHRRLFTHRGLERLLRYYGFKIEKSVGSYFVGLPIWLGRLVCKIDKYHSSCAVIKARKE